MSASEKLREMIAAAQTPNHGEDTWEEKEAWDRYNEAYFKLERIMSPHGEALPLIADVVEAAERMAEELDAHGLSTHMKDSECEAGYVLGRGRASLTALTEHLEGQ